MAITCPAAPVFSCRFFRQFPEEWGGADAGSDGVGGGGDGGVLQAEGGVELGDKAPQEADAVFDLDVVLIVVLIGEGASGADVEFIGAEEHPGAGLFKAFCAEGVHLVDDGAGGLPVHGLKLGEALAVLGEAHGDDGAAGEAPGGHVLHGALEVFAVVPAGAEDDLAVHDDARGAEGAHILQALPAGLAA